MAAGMGKLDKACAKCTSNQFPVELIDVNKYLCSLLKREGHLRVNKPPSLVRSTYSIFTIFFSSSSSSSSSSSQERCEWKATKAPALNESNEINTKRWVWHKVLTFIVLTFLTNLNFTESRASNYSLPHSLSILLLLLLYFLLSLFIYF